MIYLCSSTISHALRATVFFTKEIFKVENKQVYLKIIKCIR